jgi:hypothetical protein
MRRTAIFIAVLATASIAVAESKVLIESATDATKGSRRQRAQNTITLRRTLDDLLASHTVNANAHVDATVVSLTVQPKGKLMIVSAQVRLAISDDNGRILSVLVGGAKVEAPRADRGRLGHLRDEAVSAAAEGMFDKLKTSLSQARSQTRAEKRIALARP